jgi:putative ABC transport system substrate-binding protein
MRRHQAMHSASRREFITLLGGAAVASAVVRPIAASAQQPVKLPTIGFLAPIVPAAEWAAAFHARLRALGWIEGRNIAIEYRFAEGRIDRLAALADELVRLEVDVILTGGTPAVLAAKRATSVIPIIFSSGGDPIGTGLVTSLARPGGNVTGFSLMNSDLAGKRLELLRQVVPDLGRLLVMANVSNPDSLQEMGQVRAVARMLALEVSPVEIRRAEDISPAFEAIKGRADALYLCGDPLAFNNRVRINSLALGARLPTMHGNRELVEAGGLMSYATNFPDLFRRSAELVDKVLRRTKPADIPVEQPTKFDLVVNMKTAKALDLTISERFLARADEVIE